MAVKKENKLSDAYKVAVRNEMLWNQHDAHLGSLSPEALRDLARNESSPLRWRMAATERLMDQNSPYVNHPDLQLLVERIKQLREEAVNAEVNKEQEEKVKMAEIPSQHEDENPGGVSQGVFHASVVTNSLMQDEKS